MQVVVLGLLKMTDIYIYIYNCLFKDNKGSVSSCLINSSYAKIINSVFITNTTTTIEKRHGTLFNYQPKGYPNTSFTIISSTVISNVGLGIYSEKGVDLYNCIVYNNSVNDILIDSIGSIYTKNNLVGISNVDLRGNGNILNTDPLFVGNEDYRLQVNSPAIDAGDKSFLPDTILTDLLGNPRITGSSIDIGAYEYQSTASSVLTNQSKSNIYSIGHTIYVNNSSSQPIRVFNVMGELVTRSESSEITVSQSGVYLVQVGNLVQKVIVR